MHDDQTVDNLDMEIEDLEERLSSALAELMAIDDILTPCVALVDKPDRLSKIRHAIGLAAVAEDRLDVERARCAAIARKQITYSAFMFEGGENKGPLPATCCDARAADIAEEIERG